jgi:metal-responsive CopG/Arc/MetJ family transcriptional regulator
MAKIAISLPDDVLRDVERERRHRGESRSKFFRRAVEAFLRHEREREDIERYVSAYQRDPETPEELDWVEEVSTAALEDYLWSPEGGE